LFVKKHKILFQPDQKNLKIKTKDETSCFALSAVQNVRKRGFLPSRREKNFIDKKKL
jgi:hypothetical protein